MSEQRPTNFQAREGLSVRWRSAATVESSGVLSRGGNSFVLIRFILSFAVIVSHCWPIGGYGEEPLLAFSRRNVTLGTFAVTGFFALSGILVGRSADRLPTGMYLWHRCRRILPGFWTCLIVTAFVFGPLIAWVREMPLSVISNPIDSSATTFVTRNFTLNIGQTGLGSVLEGLPYPIAINGSLWSLAYEFACYLTVIVLVRLWILSGRNRVILISVTVLSLVMAIIVSLPPETTAGALNFPLLGPILAYQFFTLWAVFLVGTLIGVYASRIPLCPMLVIAASTICAATIPMGLFRPLGSLMLPFVLVGIGFYLPRPTRKLGERNDISYGLYLYGFPMTQLLVAAGLRGGGAALAISTVLATSVVAWLSWVIVERPLLGQGRRGIRTST
jgi:peptidoglycan/LPS O-acetylase OafA/YrhL